MMKDRRIIFYDTMDGPNQALIQENARLTPAERWEAYKKLYHLYVMLTGIPVQQPKSLTIERPSWM